MPNTTPLSDDDSRRGPLTGSADGRAGRLACLVFVLAAAVYCRTFLADFVSIDDPNHVTANPYLRPLSWSGLRALWSSPYQGIYSPGSYTLFAAETWLAEGKSPDGRAVLSPLVFHAGNVALHALASVLVFVVLRRLVHAPWAAFCGALLFAWHPLQVESVAWISGTPGVLAGVFSLAAVYEYLRFRGAAPFDENDDSENDIRRAWLHYALACLAYGLALLSKPTAVAVPLMLCVLDVIWLRRSAWSAALWVGWWIIPALALASVTNEQQALHVAEFVYVPPWYLRPLVAADALVFYLAKLVLPVGLSVANGRPIDALFQSNWIYAMWIVPAVLLALAAWSTYRRAWLTALGLFVAGLAPVLGFVPFVYQEISTVASRYAYLPMLGPALAMAWLMTLPRFRVRRIETALLLATLGACTVWQTGFWRDSRTVAERGLATNRNSVVALSTLAQLEIDEGNYPQAELRLLQAAEADPDGAKVWTNLGIFYFETGHDNAAAEAFTRAIEVSQRDPAPHIYLARIQIRQGKHAEAIAAMSHLVEQMPQLVDARLVLGQALLAGGRPDDARRELEIVLQQRPGDAAALEALRHIDAMPASAPNSAP